MELKAIKVELFKQDEEPDFNVEEYESQGTINHDSKADLNVSFEISRRQLNNASQMSQFGQSNRSIASIMNSPEKKNSVYIKGRNENYQSISPDKARINKNKQVSRPTFSAHKNKKALPAIHNKISFERTSYSPSPERKSLYWQSWMLPMNETTREKKNEPPPKITAKSYICMMSDTQEVLASQDCRIQKQVASLTKIMTAYTALNICSSFGVKIREHYVNINREAAWMNGTSAGLKEGEDILIIDLLYALLLPSGNDAGVAIAQFFGKFLSYKFAQDNSSNDSTRTSMDKFKEFKDFYDSQYDKQSLALFIFEMNRNCHKLGLQNTHFNNPTGLSDPKNYSCSMDMAVLTAHCLKNHTLRTMFKKKFHTCEVRNEKMCTTRQIQWKNTNRHLYQFRECIGVKTGITPNAGPCLSSAYKVLGRELVVIVIDCTSVEDRYADCEKLLKWTRKKVRAF